MQHGWQPKSALTHLWNGQAVLNWYLSFSEARERRCGGNLQGCRSLRCCGHQHPHRGRPKKGATGTVGLQALVRFLDAVFKASRLLANPSRFGSAQWPPDRSRPATPSTARGEDLRCHLKVHKPGDDSRQAKTNRRSDCLICRAGAKTHGGNSTVGVGREIEALTGPTLARPKISAALSGWTGRILKSILLFRIFSSFF